jgi:hypothetical protein
MYWTLRALARAGYMVIENAEVKIFVTENGWEIDKKKMLTVEALLKELDKNTQINCDM